MEVKDAEMQQVIERLERVERQNRRLMHGGLALVLTCGIVLLMAQKPAAQTIEAQAFVLKDAAGQVRAELHLTDSGPELGLYTYTRQPKAEVRLGVGKDGPALSLVEGRGKVALLTAGEDESALLLGAVGRGHARAHLGVGNDGPNLSLTDFKGYDASFGSEALVSPTTGEKLQFSAASIHLFDPKGKTLWSAP